MQYKNYRNLLSTLVKDSKQTTYFKKDIKDTKKNWKSIKSIISMESKNNNSLLKMGSALQNLQLLKMCLMIFFHSAAPAIQSKIMFSCKSFNDFFLQRIMTLSP